MHSQSRKWLYKMPSGVSIFYSLSLSRNISRLSLLSQTDFFFQLSAPPHSHKDGSCIIELLHHLTRARFRQKMQFDHVHLSTLSATLQTSRISFKMQRGAKYTNIHLHLIHLGKIISVKEVESEIDKLDWFCRCFIVESHKPAILIFFFFFITRNSATVFKNIQIWKL